MARKLLPDDLWAVIEPLTPPTPPPGPKGSRPRLGDRRALTGILFVLRTGLPWEDLPAESGCGRFLGGQDRPEPDGPGGKRAASATS